MALAKGVGLALRGHNNEDVVLGLLLRSVILTLPLLSKRNADAGAKNCISISVGWPPRSDQYR